MDSSANLATIGTLAAVEAAVTQANMEPNLNIWERQPSGNQAGTLPWHTGWPVHRAGSPFWMASDQTGGADLQAGIETTNPTRR